MRNTILALRFSLAFLMLWIFFDKALGLNWPTEHGLAWVDGVSPTAGFLRGAVQGPFAGFFSFLAASKLVEWVYMAGLFGIGLSFLIGKYMRFAGYSGAVMMALVYLAVLWPVYSPVIDEHVIYGLAFLIVGFAPEARSWLSVEKD